MAEQYIDKSILKIVREKLWSISNNKKITLEDIQDRTGFSYSQVYRIVRGTNNNLLVVLLLFVKHLKCNHQKSLILPLSFQSIHLLRKNMKIKK
ncbi:helix-turn-helix domain-containing protein [Pedobacter sp. V48]|uniref:helix-turn-helix domain-containing protein n=1 Tax=Pedobacter sp. V48 TaxID=509635 RepID=UPI0003E4A4A7|nr:hypothetical protein N824_16670 [Pedobacter sp. V48]